MNNQTAGLFGGLLLGITILGTAAWISPGVRSWLVGVIGGTPATSTSSSSSAGAGTPAMGSSSFGSFNSLPASSTQPYQLVYNPSTGVSIATAATLPDNETPSIALPSLAQLAPTSPSLVA